MADAEKRYGTKPTEKAAKKPDPKPAGEGTPKPKDTSTKTPDTTRAADESPIAGGVLSEVFKRHLDERRQTHTRHEREHREMADRHMRELGGTLSMSDVVDASGVGGESS